MKRSIVLAVLAITLIGVVPALAAPPGADEEVNRSADFNANWTGPVDGATADIQVNFNSDDPQTPLWLHVNTATFGCNSFHSDFATFDYSPSGTTVSATFTPDFPCWPHETGEPFEVAAFTVTVTTLDQDARKIRWHSNSTGEQCKGINFEDNDIDALAWDLVIPEIGLDTNASGTSFGNFASSSSVCHLTGTRGKPPKA